MYRSAQATLHASGHGVISNNLDWSLSAQKSPDFLDIVLPLCISEMVKDIDVINRDYTDKKMTAYRIVSFWQHWATFTLIHLLRAFRTFKTRFFVDKIYRVDWYIVSHGPAAIDEYSSVFLLAVAGKDQNFTCFTNRRIIIPITYLILTVFGSSEQLKYRARQLYKNISMLFLFPVKDGKLSTGVIAIFNASCYG